MFRTAITLLWVLAPLHALAQSPGDRTTGREMQRQAPDQSYYSGEAKFTEEGIVPVPEHVQKDTKNDWGRPSTATGDGRPAARLRSVVTDAAGGGLMGKLGGPVVDSANGRGADSQIRTAQMTGIESGDRVRGGTWNSSPAPERDVVLAPPNAAIGAEESHPRGTAETSPVGRRYLAAPPAIGSGFGAEAANYRVASQDRSFSGPPPTAAPNQPDDSVPLAEEDPLAVTGDALGKHPLTQSRWVLWLTMGLFASLAGNLFFGWVAWDTHARYQDLVDDMHESENRLDKQRRQPRDENLRTTAGSREFSYSGTDRNVEP